MSNLKKNYQIYETADGSLSLEYHSSSNTSEAMHHSAGAVSETLYIYKPAIEWAIENSPEATHVLSIGLGVGLNEMLIAACLKDEVSCHLTIDSYESESWLTEEFLSWLIGQPTNLISVYDVNLNLICDQLHQKPSAVKETLRLLYEDKKLIMHGGIEAETQFPQSYNCILYDFFSSKINEVFWTQEFVTNFLKNHAQNTCSFSTYAATSALKKALRNCDFSIEKKAGFSGKRECTFATRK